MAETTSTPASDPVLNMSAPSVLYAKIYEKNKVYLGPRKIDDSPQATFNYGDGKYIMSFHYKKDSKAAERGGNSQSVTNPEDKSKSKGMLNGVPAIDGGGSIVTGD